MSKLKSDLTINSQGYAVIGMNDTHYLAMSINMLKNRQGLWAHRFYTVTKGDNRELAYDENMQYIKAYIKAGYEMLVKPEQLGLRSDLWQCNN